MGKILCFISQDFADFEITFALHKLRNVGGMDVLAVGYDDQPVTSESGLAYRPHLDLAAAQELDNIDGLLLPGGPIREQKEALTEWIAKLHRERRLLAAICNGPQYLGRAGVLNDRRFTTSCSAERIRQLGASDPFPWDRYVDERVVRDGHVITAKGRAFIDFSFALFDALDIYGGRASERDQLFRDVMNR